MPSKSILITGGAGFIGSHLVRLFIKSYPDYHIYNLDALTYAGNLENLRDVEKAPNYTFIKADITNQHHLEELFQKFKFENIIHLAAESHVDRSITDPLAFVKTNIVGTLNLLNSFRDLWRSDFEGHLFYHISTDEVYGSLGEEGLFTETTPYSPNSPYSASKASSDHFVRAYGETYDLPYIISNCSNNYGPFQFPEKLIPLMINNIIEEKKLPVYGDGKYTRDWLYVEDHVKAIDMIFHNAKPGETYNIGGLNEWKNLEVIRLLCQILDRKLNREAGTSEKLINFIKDRPGHDRRYAIDSAKLKLEIGWSPAHDFKEGLEITVQWYLDNQKWLKHIISGDYRKYYKSQYSE